MTKIKVNNLVGEYDFPDKQVILTLYMDFLAQKVRVLIGLNSTKSNFGINLLNHIWDIRKSLNSYLTQVKYTLQSGKEFNLVENMFPKAVCINL